MNYHSEKNSIKDKEADKIIAMATSDRGAEIIAKALNFYFGDSLTRNQTIGMMHENTSDALSRIADFAEQNKLTAVELVAWMREIADEMKGQSLVVSICDELKIDRPKE